jgi:hypothetical protein
MKTKTQYSNAKGKVMGKLDNKVAVITEGIERDRLVHSQSLRAPRFAVPLRPNRQAAYQCPKVWNP